MSLACRELRRAWHDGKRIQSPTGLHLVRGSAAARSAAYASAMVGVRFACFRLPHDSENPFDAHVHPQAFPGVMAITDLLTRLRPKDRAA